MVVEVLPEMEADLPAAPASPAFWRGPDIQTLAQQQGAQPVADFGSLLGGWPEDEPTDDFLAALGDWRQESHDKFSDL